MLDLTFIKHWFGAKNNIPSNTDSGTLYFASDSQEIYVDNGQERICMTPKPDWNETNTNKSSHILNKPTLGTVASHDVASDVDQTSNIPTSQMVNNALTSLNTSLSGDISSLSSTVNELSSDFTQAEVWKSQGQEGEVLSTNSEGNIEWIDINSVTTDILNKIEILNRQVNYHDLKINGYDSATLVWLENVGNSIDLVSLLSDMQSGTRVKITNINITVSTPQDVSNFYDDLDRMVGYDGTGPANINGNITITNPGGTGFLEYSSRYPNILLNNMIALIYKNHDGSATIAVDGVTPGGNGARINTLAREADVNYKYTPNGWSLVPNGAINPNALNNVTTNRVVYAAYSTSPSIYTVTFVRDSKDGGGTLETQTEVHYGQTPVYGGATPTTTRGTSDKFEFVGWTPALGPIKDDMTYTAKFRDLTPLVLQYLGNYITEYTSDTNTTVSQYGLAYLTTLTNVEAPLTSIGQYAFYNDTALTTVDLTSPDP